MARRDNRAMKVKRLLCVMFSIATVVPFGAAAAAVPTIVSPVTGRLWMDRNLRADRVAQSPVDARSFGAIYRWNSATAYPSNAEDEWDPRVWGDESIHLKSGVLRDKEVKWSDEGWEAGNNPCPPGFDIPTKAEWEAEKIKDAADGFAKLRLPLAMYRASEGYTQGFGWDEPRQPAMGFYWSRTTQGDIFFQYFDIGRDRAGVGFVGGAYGMSMRCIGKP